MAKGKDRFVQYASLSITESAANTLTYAQLTTGGMLFQRRAMIIHRIEYMLNANDLDAEGDTAAFGLVTSNQSAPGLGDPNTVDFNIARRLDFGTAASAQMYMNPVMRDFSTLAEGGLIIPAHPIFLFAQGTSLPAALVLTARIYFTIEELSAEEFVELVEALRVIT